MNKVFGIGLNKTGTTTLGQMGEILGLRCTSCDRGLLEDFVLKNDFTRIRERVEHYDLFEDWPWPLIYRQLDELYPGSKFILTVRKNEEKWFESLCKHSFKTHPTEHCRKLAYGFNFPQQNRADHLLFYKNHNAAVREYFQGRDNDFMEICWEDGDGFVELCGFLDIDPPSMDTPHANKASNASVPVRRIWANRILSALNF